MLLKYIATSLEISKNQEYYENQCSTFEHPLGSFPCLRSSPLPFPSTFPFASGSKLACTCAPAYPLLRCVLPVLRFGGSQLSCRCSPSFGCSTLEHPSFIRSSSARLAVARAISTALSGPVRSAWHNCMPSWCRTSKSTALRCSTFEHLSLQKSLVFGVQLLNTRDRGTCWPHASASWRHRCAGGLCISGGGFLGQLGAQCTGVVGCDLCHKPVS